MHKRLAVLALLAFGTLALAAGAVSATQYQLDSTNAAPTVITEGQPLTLNGAPATGLTVSVSDYNDGGADHDFIWLGNVKAFVWNKSLKFPDGGAGWMRAPQYDFAGTLTGAPIQADKVHGHSYTFPATTTLPAADGDSRIYFQTTGVLGNDAGTPRHTIKIQVRY